MEKSNLVLNNFEIEYNYSDIFYVDRNKKGFLYESSKRIFDIIFSIFLLFLTSPIIIITAIFIKIDSSGPIIYKQKRVGLSGKIFTIYKFRSMYSDAEKYFIKWADKDDDRITRVGKFIRKTRIDELPQLINVLKGEMSLIGPRPERPEFTYEFMEKIPNFINRLSVKPGITGWAQVNGGYEMIPDEKLILDIFYINHRNILFECIIFLKTIKVILTGVGSR